MDPRTTARFDHPDGDEPAPPARDRLDARLDELLREMAQASPADLKARVMTALDRGAARRGLIADWFGGGSNVAWRPALSLAIVAVLIVAGFLLVRQTAAPDRRSARGPGAAASPSATPPAGESARSIAPLSATSPVTAAAAATSEPSARRAAAMRRRRAGSSAAGRPWQTDPVDVSALSNEPYMPGAPVGDLGDALDPLPAPPRIAFAPITQSSVAPSRGVSDIARPVTDFPADNQSPASENAAGTSGGTRR